jgi:ubiquinol-cytochrome c reductase cytochrome c subunit
VSAAVAVIVVLLALAPAASAQDGKELFEEACSACHGQDLRGVPGRGPALRGVGARSADFYVQTGRMPLADPHDEPVRNPPAYDARRRQALVDYVASFGGPPVPAVKPERGSIAQGRRLFADACAGCHQVVAQGGIVPPSGVAPPLAPADATAIAEAIRVGPYLMPAFDERRLDDREVDSIVRYVLSARAPHDRGGWGIGHIGPVPEGMVAWLIGGVAVLLVARLLGERLR